jgi:diguanylate cyclase (GGDEF)-like protein
MKRNPARLTLPLTAASALTASCAAVGLGYLVSLPHSPNLAILVIPVFAASFTALLVVTGERALDGVRSDMETRAVRDPQTGLMPAHMAERVLAVEFAAAQRGRPLTVVLFSIDDFTRNASLYGDSAALRWRRAAGRVLRQRTRGMNVSARCRSDGLFLTILSDVPLQGACTFATRVRRDYAALLPPDEPKSLSAGVAAYDIGMSAPAELIAHAERALTRARSKGGTVMMVGVATGGAVRSAHDAAARRTPAHRPLSHAAPARPD